MGKCDANNNRFCQAALVLSGTPRGQKQITVVRRESVTSCLVEFPDQAQRCIYDNYDKGSVRLVFKISDDVLDMQ